MFWELRLSQFYLFGSTDKTIYDASEKYVLLLCSKVRQQIIKANIGLQNR